MPLYGKPVIRPKITPRVGRGDLWRRLHRRALGQPAEGQLGVIQSFRVSGAYASLAV